ncbi:MAG: tRNA (adenosine(37)-N6)-threonylcarbamoyltransferase complex dimerization subunit type 1 TsaB, partial [bacterium (Candidatus Ratteibacteria) CG23_combo_of_CG06-09_8_20_14_all_48_7]
MRVLAIETTGEVKSIALAEDRTLIGEISFSGNLLTEFWPRLDAFLRENRKAIKDIDLFAACNGPGSWTG